MFRTVGFWADSADKIIGTLINSGKDQKKNLSKGTLFATILAAATGAGAETNITGNVTLTADADWRGLGQVVLADGASIDLAEHSLKVDGFAQSPIGEDVTSPSGAVTANNLYSSSGLPEFLFDNRFYYSTGTPIGDPDKNHRILGKVKCDVTYDFGEGNEECIQSYRIYHSSNQEEGKRAPKAWTFAGSHDGNNWITLDTRTGQTGWSKGEARAFSFPNAAAYRYYRLEVTEAVGDTFVELYQLEFFRDSEYCTDRTVPGAERVTSSTLNGGSVASLFDNNFTHNSDHRLLAHRNNFPCDITYDFGSGCETALNGYRIYYKRTDSDSADRAPKKWTFEGTDDTNTTWTVLDSRENITDWPAPPCERTFSFANPNSYRFYKLHLEQSVGSTYIEFYQLEYFHDKVFGELTVDVASGTAQTNGVISLEGDLRLVKDGAGSFMAACPNQTYCGGTVVSNGTLIAGLAGDAAPLGAPNGTDSDDSVITVGAGGVFDVNGLGGWWNYPIVLDGGTLRCAMAETDAPEDTFRYIALTSDSALEVEGDFVMGDGTGTAGCLDLGGHVLTASVSSNGLWTLNLPSVTAGTIAFDLGEEDAHGEKKVMAWGERPANVQFTKAPDGFHGVTEQSDGVYVRSRATVLSFR